MLPLDEFLAIEFGSSAPEDSAAAGEEREILLEAIRRLPEDRQQVLILKFVEGLSNAGIGEVMGRTEGAVKSLYHRTLLALRDDFAEHSHFEDRDGGKMKRGRRRGLLRKGR